MISITRRFSFCYAHTLPDYNGPCQNMHGHNSIIEVEIAQAEGFETFYPLPRPGMIMDFVELKKIVEPIIGELDHQYLNDLEAFSSSEYEPPTAENIAWYLAKRIVLELPLDIELIRLRVSETDNCWAEWRENDDRRP